MESSAGAELGQGSSLSPAGGSAAHKQRRTPDKRKAVLQIDPGTKKVVKKHDSQKDAVAAVHASQHQMSAAIKKGDLLQGFLWEFESGTGTATLPGRNAEGASQCPLSEHRAGRRLAVAMDVGHAGTGYGFEYKDKRGGISVQAFATDEPDNTTGKAPTCILLDENKRCIAFGKAARALALQIDRTGHLVDEEGRRKAYFFEDFKMELQKYSRGAGPEVTPAIPKGDSMCISVRHLLQEIFKLNKDQALEKAEAHSAEPIVEVIWVITVPADWSDQARDLVKAAARDAGLSDQGQEPVGRNPIMKILMPAEPEAACQWATLSDPVSVNEVILIVDLGGGTVDTTMHRIAPWQNVTRNKMRKCGGKEPFGYEELEKCGRPLGSKMIDTLFKEVLKNDVFQPTEYERISDKTMDQLIRNFQNIKHTFGAARGQCVSIDLAGVILESKIPGDNAEGILNARFGQKGLEMRGFYLYLTRELIEERLFRPVVDEIVEMVRDSVLKAARKRNVPDRIILAGGFGTSPYVQKRLKAATRPEAIFADGKFAEFRNPKYLKWTVDSDPLFTVLKGAVLYGLNHDDFPFSRRARYTYGIDFDQELDAFKDEFPERMEGLSDRTIFRDSKFGMYVRDRFGPLVKKGSLMVCGQRALAPDQYRCLNDETYVKLFQSTNDEAIFVSDPAVTKIGEGVKIEEARRGDKIAFRFHFDGDQIKVYINVHDPDGRQKGETQVSSINHSFKDLFED